MSKGVQVKCVSRVLSEISRKSFRSIPDFIRKDFAKYRNKRMPSALTLSTGLNSSARILSSQSVRLTNHFAQPKAQIHFQRQIQGVNRTPCNLCTAVVPRGACHCQFSTSEGSSAKKVKLKGKSVSAQKWILRQNRDPFVKRARLESYRCRSAYKLEQIDDQFDLMRPGHVVIDCGAAPGSWSQVAVNRVNALGNEAALPVGKVIGIDLHFMENLPGATFLDQTDFTKKGTQDQILKLLNGQKANIVLSDMAPNPTGLKSMDHDLIVKLCYSALHFALGILAPGGSFVCKLWMGQNQSQLQTILKKLFEHVKVFKPEASRTDSSEIFLVAKNLKENIA